VSHGEYRKDSNENTAERSERSVPVPSSHNRQQHPKRAGVRGFISGLVHRLSEESVSSDTSSKRVSSALASPNTRTGEPTTSCPSDSSSSRNGDNNNISNDSNSNSKSISLLRQSLSYTRRSIPDFHLVDLNDKLGRGIREALLAASALRGRGEYIDLSAFLHKDGELDQDLTYLGGSGCREEQQQNLEDKFHRSAETSSQETCDNSAEKMPDPNGPPSLNSSIRTGQQSPSGGSVNDDKPLAPAVLIYHESARSIVFRDHLRRQASSSSINTISSIAPPGSHPRSRSASRSRPRTPIKGRGKKLKGLTEASDEEGGESDSSAASASSKGSRGSRSSRSSRGSRGSKSSRVHRHHRCHSNASSDVGLSIDGSYHDTIDTSRHSISSMTSEVIIGGFTPQIDPLPKLDLTQNDEFTLLLESDPDNEEVWSTMSEAEREIVEALRDGFAVVKTISNSEWTSFLKRFQVPVINRRLAQSKHEDKPPSVEEESNSDAPLIRIFNSFVSSTSLLPSNGKKMRCYGSTKQYITGVVFQLPISYPSGESEEEAVTRTRTWSWPAGYSAKTEFNIDNRGNLINGREEALVSLSGLRKLNNSYLHDKDHEIGGRIIKGGLNTVPYNEVYMRIGGPGRIVRGIDCATGRECRDEEGTGRSLEYGIGLPAALFIRTACYGSLISLLRTRARCNATFGKDYMKGLPLLMITPELGVRVLTDALQKRLLQTMSRDLNPFQNALLAHKTTVDNSSEAHMQQKLEELLDLDSDDIRNTLTAEECARLAGGFGATDDSVAHLLMDVLREDLRHDGETNDDGDEEDGHGLQDIVNDGLESAVRSGDYNTSRQLLILYTLVASKGHKESAMHAEEDNGGANMSSGKISNGEEAKALGIGEDMEPMTPLNTPSEPSHMQRADELATKNSESTLSKDHFPPPPPPPPLDTDRLRSATNSDGLLSVLGAAQVLKSMQDGGAKKRVEEAVLAIEEWVEKGEQSVAFRLASWRDQRAAQGDLKIAMEHDSNFMTFISNKAIANRKKFASQLRDAVSATDFESLRFLQSLHALVASMHSPCLRLELLQYILGLDNRYSVAHVARSIELAATCMSISEQESNSLGMIEGGEES